MKDDRTWIPGAADLDWIESLAAPVHPALVAIEEAAQPERIPILDRDSGRVLATYAAGRRNIVEIGTAFGYSTLWMALAQSAGATIVTIDPDRERTDRARGWWREADIPDERIRVVNAPALDAFAAGAPELEGPFDLAFIDALKPEYPAYLDALLPRLAPGAAILADNVLWSGRAADRSLDDDSLRGLRTFVARILREPRVVPAATIVPVGDGLLVAVLRA